MINTRENKKLEKAAKHEIIAQPQMGTSPAAMIQLAIAGKADLDKLEKLLELQERWEANEARKVFASSFTLAQAEIECVVKKEINPQTHSKYASLEDIITSANPIYTRQGFSVIFHEGETTKPDHIRICADVLHAAGHKEPYYYDVPMDGKGIKGNANMTGIHAKASSTSYARRYLMCLIWNIPTGDDNDGNTAHAPTQQAQKVEQPKQQRFSPPQETIADAEIAKPNPEEKPAGQPPVEFTTQEELAALIITAVKNKYLPTDIETKFRGLGYTLRGGVKKSLKLSDIEQEFNRWDYETLLKEVSKEKVNKDETQK